MSLNVLTQAGGTGGASASIFVTGLSEADTVTATKDGKTVRGKWVRKVNPEWRDLSDDYTQLEYIEGTGTQYINTGFNPNQNTRVVVDLESFAATNVPRVWFGARRKSSASFYIGNNTSGDYVVQVEYGSNASATSSNYCEFLFSQSEHNARRTIDFNKNVLTLSTGQSYTFASQTFQVNAPIDLFCLNDPDYSGHSKFCEMRLYSCEIYDDGILVRDYVPAKRNSDGVLGLYDLVNDVFYTNAGTGTFIAGEEIHQYTYGHEITIKEYGMWSVTATNGEDTTTQDVLVDAAVEYEIEMSYRLYLYREGDEYTDLTGGWSVSAAGGGTLTKTEDGLLLNSSTGNAKYVTVSTANYIDITNYSKLTMETSDVSVVHCNAIVTLRADGENGVKTITARYPESTDAPTITIPAANLVTYDISDLTGKHKATIVASTGGAYSDSKVTYTVYRVWLEK